MKNFQMSFGKNLLVTLPLDTLHPYWVAAGCIWSIPNVWGGPSAERELLEAATQCCLQDILPCRLWELGRKHSLLLPWCECPLLV